MHGDKSSVAWHSLKSSVHQDPIAGSVTAVPKRRARTCAGSDCGRSAYWHHPANLHSQVLRKPGPVPTHRMPVPSLYHRNPVYSADRRKYWPVAIAHGCHRSHLERRRARPGPVISYPSGGYREPPSPGRRWAGAVG